MSQKSSHQLFALAISGLTLVATTAFAAAGGAATPGIRIEPITDPTVNSPKESLRLSLFQDTPTKAACVTVRTSPDGKTGKDESLDNFLKELVTAVEKASDVGLQPLFHRRMNVKLAAIADIYAKIANTYGTPIDVSVKQLWAINTIDGTPSDFDCPNTDHRIKVRALYGYPLQFGVWLQIMGQKELGLIYAGIVPAEGRWNLGSFNVQQWTHDSRDSAAWVKAAANDAAKGLKQAAYAKYDLAAKLLDGGNYIAVDGADAIVKARNDIMATTDWDKSIRSALKGDDVIYTSTLLVVGGAGILARIRIPQEVSTEDLQKRCKKLVSAVAAQPWSTGLQGMRCDFSLPHEDPSKDGVLGGLYIAFDELRAKKR